MKIINLADFQISNNNQLIIIAGPCVIESEALAIESASYLKKVCGELDINFIYKSSFDKANRTSGCSYRGPGLDGGLHALRAECLREWQDSVVIPGRRAILDEKKGARFAKSLRQLALAEYDRSAGRCARASVVSLTH